jgi:hypothetical protein
MWHGRRVESQFVKLDPFEWVEALRTHFEAFSNTRLTRRSFEQRFNLKGKGLGQIYLCQTFCGPDKASGCTAGEFGRTLVKTSAYGTDAINAYR